MKLSNKVKITLQKYGWNENYRIDSEKIKSTLELEGYTIFDKAIEFIEKVGNIYFLIPRENLPKGDLTHFDSCKAAKNIYIETVHEWENRINESLIPVGETNNYQCTLLISTSGKIYAGLDDFLALVGESAEDAIEALFENKEVKQIP